MTVLQILALIAPFLIFGCGVVVFTQNIVGADGDVNIAGLKRFIYVVKADDIASMPTLNATKTAWVGDITLKPTKRAVKIDQVVGEDASGMIENNLQGTTGGKSFLSKLMFKVSAMDASQLQLANIGANGNLVFIAQDRMGRNCIFGTPDIPATSESMKIGTGNAAADFRGGEFGFHCSSGYVPAEYTGKIIELTVPVPLGADAGTVTASGFTARWNALVDFDNTNITTFKLYVSTASDFTTYVATYNGKAVTGLTEALTGLTASTTYYYKVSAVVGGVEGGQSNVVAVRTSA